MMEISGIFNEDTVDVIWEYILATVRVLHVWKDKNSIYMTCMIKDQKKNKSTKKVSGLDSVKSSESISSEEGEWLN